MKLYELINAAVRYDSGDPKRVQHFLKVYAFAETIGGSEGLSPRELEILRAAAVLHDIGIRECERKYGSCEGRLQQIEGVPVAREILDGLGADAELTERVCFLIAHHHTYAGINSADWQILVEADFLVNIFEENMSPEAAKEAGDKIFKTSSGKELLEKLYFS
ncbi:MAG: HD domain-containing protein [Prevotella sp.]|nr:HD domain-containing protein [Prevotella sp.]